MTERLRWSLRWRLSVLWILEWGITGALLTYLPLYFEKKGLSLDQTGPLLAIGAVGLWIAPLVVGQICDRWMASERYLAVAHFVGGVSLVFIPIAADIHQETGENFRAILVIFGIYAAAYVPTMPLASALTFRHLSDPKRQFGGVRIWGTVGWVLAGVGLSVWLQQNEAGMWIREHVSWGGSLLDRVGAVVWWLPVPDSSDCFHIAALLSFMLSTFCVFLPHTPPARTPRGQFAPLELLRMFRQRSFVQLIVVSFLLAMVIPLYSLAAPALLEKNHFDADWVPAVMTVGQISEFPALLLLPLFLRRFGLKTTYAIGVAAWLVRFALFALATWTIPVLLGIALHGVCHVFLVIVIQLYVDEQCPRDLRNSAQNLFAFLTLGVATPLGLLASRPLVRWCTDAAGEIQFHWLFGAAAALLAVLLLGFDRWFKPIEPEEASQTTHLP